MVTIAIARANRRFRVAAGASTLPIDLRSPSAVALQFRAAGAAITRRRREMTGALLLVLTGFAAAAFGIAANSPTPGLPAQSLLSESLEPIDIGRQVEMLAGYPIELFRSDVTRPGDSAASLLQRLQVFDVAAVQFLRADPLGRSIFDGRAGKSIRVRTDVSGRMLELIARSPASDRSRNLTHFSRLRIELVGDRLMSTVESAALAPRLKVASGTIVSSLFEATDVANVPDAIAGQVADVLSGDIDFHRGLRKGDTFSLVYELLTADGEAVSWSGFAGRLLATEFVIRGRRHSAVWYQGQRGKGGYYGFDGRSKQRTFLASPLEFSRVSSGFTSRIHPILKQWQQHRGVDYTAPSGTPVRSVADGVVDFSGVRGGYGNVVEVRHGNDRVTLYAHLSRIDVRLGQRLEQGERVGAVGATGWATGPHLHFEFRVAGVAHNPAKLAQWAEATMLASSDEAPFTALRRSVQDQLELTPSAARNGDFVE